MTTAFLVLLSLIALLWLWLLLSRAHRATFTDLLNLETEIIPADAPSGQLMIMIGDGATLQEASATRN